jgi:hypothetical protein
LREKTEEVLEDAMRRVGSLAGEDGKEEEEGGPSSRKVARAAVKLGD